MDNKTIRHFGKNTLNEFVEEVKERIISKIEKIEKAIPTKISQLENDTVFATEDYVNNNAGKVKTVNGNEPDENGNIEVDVEGISINTITSFELIEPMIDEDGNMIVDEDGAIIYHAKEVKDGQDGYTPVKGVDYFTEEDKQEIINSVPKGVVSWDELEGKLFGEEVTESTILEETTFTREDAESVYIFGNYPLETNKTYTVVLNGKEYIGNSIDYVEEDTPCVLIKLVDENGEYVGAVSYFESMQMTVGVTYGELTSETFAIYCDETTIKPLDNKFIDAEWMAKEEVTTKNTNTLEWNGDSTGKETLDVMGDGTIIAVKISSECNVVNSDFVGCVVTSVNEYNQEERTFEIASQEELVNVSPNPDGGYMYMATDNNTICFLVANEDVDMDGVVFSKGVWLFRCDIGSTIVHTSSVRATSDIFTVETTTATPLPEKFIPDTVATKEWVEKQTQQTVNNALAQAKESGVFDGKDGQDGKDGENGQDGYTPVRGTDYWTETDKAEIKAFVDEAILGGAW